MKILRMSVCVWAALLGACGDDGGGEGDGEVEQVVDELAQFCTATFTADYELRDSFGDLLLAVAAGDQFLLTDIDLFPELVYRTANGVATLEIEDGAPIESPCLAADAVVTSELVAFTEIEVFADDTFAEVVCTIPRFEHHTFASSGYSAVDGGYEVILGGEFCDGLATGYVRQSVVQLSGTSYIGSPLVTLDRLDG